MVYRKAKFNNMLMDMISHKFLLERQALHPFIWDIDKPYIKALCDIRDRVIPDIAKEITKYELSSKNYCKAIGHAPTIYKIQRNIRQAYKYEKWLTRLTTRAIDYYLRHRHIIGYRANIRTVESKWHPDQYKRPVVNPWAEPMDKVCAMYGPELRDNVRDGRTFLTVLGNIHMMEMEPAIKRHTRKDRMGMLTTDPYFRYYESQVLEKLEIGYTLHNKFFVDCFTRKK